MVTHALRFAIVLSVKSYKHFCKAVEDKSTTTIEITPISSKNSPKPFPERRMPDLQYNLNLPKRGSLPPEEIKTLGELICFLRERAMLTQRDLAARVGYHYSYISRIEKNQHLPGIATLMGRFIPALEIQSEPEWLERLLELASGIPKKPSVSADAAAKPTVNEEKVYRPPVSLTSLLG